MTRGREAETALLAKVLPFEAADDLAPGLTIRAVTVSSVVAAAVVEVALLIVAADAEVTARLVSTSCT